jgi:hypothetical protein
LAVLIALIAATSPFTAAATTLTFKSIRAVTFTGRVWIVDTIRWTFATIRRRFTIRRTTTVVIRRSATVSESNTVLITSFLLSTILGSHLCMLRNLRHSRGLWRRERRPSILCRSQSTQYLYCLFRRDRSCAHGLKDLTCQIMHSCRRRRHSRLSITDYSWGWWNKARGRRRRRYHVLEKGKSCRRCRGRVSLDVLLAIA